MPGSIMMARRRDDVLVMEHNHTVVMPQSNSTFLLTSPHQTSSATHTIYIVYIHTDHCFRTEIHKQGLPFLDVESCPIT